MATKSLVLVVLLLLELACYGYCGGSAPFSLPNNVPNEFKVLLPDTLVNYYDNNLTPAEKTVLGVLIADYELYENSSDFHQSLRSKSESLFNKVVELEKLYQAGREALVPKAKAFVDEVVIAKLELVAPDMNALNRIMVASLQGLLEFKEQLERVEADANKTMVQIKGLIEQAEEIMAKLPSLDLGTRLVERLKAQLLFDRARTNLAAARQQTFGQLEQMRVSAEERQKAENERIEGPKSRIRAQLNEAVEKYKALSDEAKESLKTQFPLVFELIQNTMFQGVVIKTFITGTEETAASSPTANQLGT